jgi:hypothetical protein
MRKETFLMVLFIFFFCCCTGKGDSSREIQPIKIVRFDLALHEYINGNCSEEDLLQAYRPFLNIYGDKVIGIGTPDSIGFFSRLKQFFSDSTLVELYKEEMLIYSDLSDIETKISFGFDVLQSEFDSINIPQLCMHVSGLNQNIVVTEDCISLSADKYLGCSYRLYQDFFYDYQRQNMTPGNVAFDYLRAFLLMHFPFQGNQQVLLDRILYEGKIRYLLSLLVPSYSDAEIMGYTESQELWCRENEAEIWNTILQQKHLYANDYLVVQKYVEDAPFTSFLSSRSPGKVGIWVGYRIVRSHMKYNPKMSLKEIMCLTDYPEILKNAKYKPKS